MNESVYKNGRVSLHRKKYVSVSPEKQTFENKEKEHQVCLIVLFTNMFRCSMI